MKIHGATELLLRRLVFGTPTHTETGLQSNVWWWTHDGVEVMDSDRNPTNPHELKAVGALVHYLVNLCGMDPATISVQSPYPLQSQALQRSCGAFASCPNDKVDTARVIVVSLCRSTHVGHLEDALEEWLVNVLRSAQSSLIIVSHEEWVIGTATPWTQLNEAVSKLNDATFNLTSSKTDAPMHCGGRVGHFLPLCCPRHPFVRSVATCDDFEVTLMKPFCTHPCFRPYDACPAKDQHLCLEPCHRHDAKLACPYPCTRALACAPHTCAMLCSQPCDCLNFTISDLRCSHNALTGCDAAGQLQFTRVGHKFVGSVCCMNIGDKALDDVVKCSQHVPAVCKHCQADVSALCRQSNDVVCSECLALRKSIREQVRYEVITRRQTEADAALEEVDHHKRYQHDAARRGVFLVNQTAILVAPKLRIPHDAEMREFEDINPEAWIPPNATLKEGTPAKVVGRALTTAHGAVYLLKVGTDARCYFCVTAKAITLAQPLLRISKDEQSANEESVLMLMGPKAAAAVVNAIDVGNYVLVASDRRRPWSASRIPVSELPAENERWPLDVPLPSNMLAEVVRKDLGSSERDEPAYIIKDVDRGLHLYIAAAALTQIPQPGNAIQVLSTLGRVVPNSPEAHAASKASPSLSSAEWSMGAIAVGDVGTLKSVFPYNGMAFASYVPKSTRLLSEESKSVVVVPLCCVELSKEEELRRAHAARDFVDEDSLISDINQRFDMQVQNVRRRNHERRQRWAASLQPKDVALATSQPDIKYVKIKEEEVRRAAARARQQAVLLEKRRADALQRVRTEEAHAVDAADQKILLSMKEAMDQRTASARIKRASTGSTLPTAKFAKH